MTKAVTVDRGTTACRAETASSTPALRGVRNMNGVYEGSLSSARR